MKNIFLMIISLFFGSSLMQSCDTSHKAKSEGMDTTKTAQKDHMAMNDGMMQVMNNSIDNMKAMKMSGDFDLDFAKMMKIHHQAAVDMSQIELTKGSNSQVQTKAKNIISTQEVEITQLQAFINTHRMADVPSKMNSINSQPDLSMNGMMEDMRKMQMTGNTDKDYVVMMISHHQGAIEMAKMQLQHGGNDQLKKMAQMMITEQTKEIAAFQEWMDNGEESLNTETMKDHKNESAQSYTCSMHPEVKSDQPGKCPKCGMDLVKKK